MSIDGFLARLTRARRPARPWLGIATNSSWWTRVMLVAGAQRKPLPKNFLQDADLSGALFEQTDLVKATLSGAHLLRANLTSADLTGADLSGADLTCADLTVADLTGADLTLTNLTGAELIHANLTGANLTGADLTDTDLTGADLTGADLRFSRNIDRAYLEDALWSERTRWPAELATSIRERSEPIGRGHWRVMGSGNTDAQVEMPLAPVG